MDKTTKMDQTSKKVERKMVGRIKRRTWIIPRKKTRIGTRKIIRKWVKTRIRINGTLTEKELNRLSQRNLHNDIIYK